MQPHTQGLRFRPPQPQLRERGASGDGDKEVIQEIIKYNCRHYHTKVLPKWGKQYAFTYLWQDNFATCNFTRV